MCVWWHRWCLCTSHRWCHRMRHHRCQWYRPGPCSPFQPALPSRCISSLPNWVCTSILIPELRQRSCRPGLIQAPHAPLWHLPFTPYPVSEFIVASLSLTCLLLFQGFGGFSPLQQTLPLSSSSASASLCLGCRFLTTASPPWWALSSWDPQLHCRLFDFVRRRTLSYMPADVAYPLRFLSAGWAPVHHQVPPLPV